MKKTIVLLLSALLLLGSAACRVEERPPVELTLVDGTLTPSGASFLLRNQWEYGIFYGDEYSLQRKAGFAWRDIDVVSGFPLTATMLPPGGEHCLDIDWSCFYGELAPGSYRLVKDYSQCDDPLSSGKDDVPDDQWPIYCEFEISE